jgi:hypothetical protein
MNTKPSWEHRILFGIIVAFVGAGTAALSDYFGINNRGIAKPAVVGVVLVLFVLIVQPIILKNNS